ncbi:MAG TPA: hypothetical protein VMB25_26225 [Bryobacteraceae bacterium]|nr:hypothetical protein [Bryobacteraceae bacterium]
MSAVDPNAEVQVARQIPFAMQNYTAETFQPYVGQVIEFERPAGATGFLGQRVRLELLEVRKPNSGGRPEGFREMFALLFALRSPEPLGNGLHRIAHDDFQPGDWFVTRVLVPGGDPGVAYYESVFG